LADWHYAARNDDDDCIGTTLGKLSRVERRSHEILIETFTEFFIVRKFHEFYITTCLSEFQKAVISEGGIAFHQSVKMHINKHT